MKNSKWIFFDLGYTLINEDQAHSKRVLDAIREVKKSGIHITSEDFIKRIIAES